MNGSIIDFDEEFIKLLKVKGFRYRKPIKASTEFYTAWVKKCNEYNTFIDFFEPLYGYMVGLGIKMNLIDDYFDKIRNRILNYLKNHIASPNEV